MNQLMLSWKAGLGLCFLFAAFLCVSQAQPSQDGLVLTTPFKKSTYNGKRFLRLKDSEKKEILYRTKDAEIARYFNAYKRNKYIGLGFMAVGIGMEATGVVMQLRDLESGALVSDGPYMVLAGALVMLTGVIISGPVAIKKLRKATERHQQLNLKTNAVLIQSPAQPQSLGLGLTLSF